MARHWKTDLRPPFLLMLFDQLPSEWGAQLHVPDEVLEAIDASFSENAVKTFVTRLQALSFRPWNLFQPDAVKVVICGQDPYSLGLVKRTDWLFGSAGSSASPFAAEHPQRGVRRCGKAVAF